MPSPQAHSGPLNDTTFQDSSLASSPVGCADRGTGGHVFVSAREGRDGTQGSVHVVGEVGDQRESNSARKS